LSTIEYFIENYPSTSSNYSFKAVTEYFLGNQSKAIQTQDKAYQLFDDFWFLREADKLYYNLGELEKSKSSLEKLKSNFPDRPPIVVWLDAVHAYHEGGYNQVYQNQLGKMYDEISSGSPAWFLALYYSVLGDDQSTFEWLEKSYERHEVEMTWLKMEPLLDPYKKDPRYDLLVRMNFPQ